MRNITYDIEKLCKSGYFRVNYIEKNSDIMQQYYDLLTEFAAYSKNYLKSYNPIVVIYESDRKEEFLAELNKIENKIASIGITQAVPEITTLRNAVDCNDVKTLSDGMRQFNARMQIISKKINDAKINDNGADDNPLMSLYFKAGSMGDGKPLILAVDDKAELLASLNGMLSDDYRVIAVTSGAAAIKAIEMYTPSIFLLDIEMPDMNGYELAKKIRENSKFDYIPILFLTAKSTRAHVVTAMAHGGNDYILKPVEKSILIQKIEHHLQKS